MAYGINLGGMQQQPAWQKLLRDLQQAGIRVDPSQTGGYAPRNIAGTNTPSQHAFGRALDINWRDNPVGFRYNLQPQPYDPANPRAGFDPANITPDAEGDRPGQTAIPSELARAVAANNQMRSGVDFRRLASGQAGPDPHHFEFLSSVPQGQQGGALTAPLERGGPMPPTTDTTSPPTAVASAGGGGVAPLAGFGSYLSNVGSNPLFLAGLTMLAGSSPAEGAAIANAISGNRLRQQQLDEHRRQFDLGYGLRQEEATQRRTLFQQEQDRIAATQKLWGEAFPGGVANPNHPLLKDVPAELATAVYGMGAEQGLPILGKLTLMDAEAKRKLLLQQQAGEQMARAIFGAGPGGVAQPAVQPGAPPPTAPAGPLGAPLPALPPELQPRTAAPTPFQAAVPQAAPAQTPIPGMPPSPQTGGLAPPPSAPLGAASPYGFQGGQRSVASGEAVLNDPQLRRIMFGHIYAGHPDKAMAAYQSALEKAQAPRLAGETKYAQDIAEGQAQDVRSAQTAREAWGLLDDLERNAKAMGNARLQAAATPTLDTAVGKYTLGFTRPTAYADRNMLLPYLDSLTLIARHGMKGQGPISDQEAASLERVLTSARNATSAEEFFSNINVARSILSRKIPEPVGYVPPHIQRQEREQAEFKARQEEPAAPAAPATVGKSMQPPSREAIVRRTDDLEGQEGATIYDFKTGRWGTVTDGKFVPNKVRRGTEGQREVLRRMYEGVE